MAHYRRRFRYDRKSSRRIHPVALIAIVLALSILAALIVGNILKKKLDDDTYQKLIGKDKETDEPISVPTVPAPAVRAYAYAFGSKLSDLINVDTGAYPSAVSLSLNTPSGTPTYQSDVTTYQGNPKTGAKLLDEMANLTETNAKLIGVFYSQACTLETEDLRFAAASEEIARLREFVNLGGEELLFCGLPTDEVGLTNSLTYLRQIRAVFPTLSVGVSLPLPTVSSASGVQILSLIKEIGCFCALDLTDLGDDAPAERLTEANYYLSSYEMRLILSEKQTALVGAAESTVGNYQILTAPKPLS